MTKKQKLTKTGECALCKTDNIELRESHIIPKFVYRRMQEFPNSRFRNLYQIKDIYQDGEKKPMLCNGCEQFFNKFETPYANRILDPYLKGEDLKELSDDIMNNFINSMSWRIIYDDLYNNESFIGTSHRNIFVCIENSLWKHLNEVRIGATSRGNIEHFKNHIFKIDDFNYKLPVKELFSHTTFGYCYSNEYGNYFIIIYFLHLVFVTEFRPIFIGTDGLIKNIISHQKRMNVKARVKEELLKYAHDVAKQFNDNEMILEEGLRDAISKRYNKRSDKLKG